MHFIVLLFECIHSNHLGWWTQTIGQLEHNAHHKEIYIFHCCVWYNRGIKQLNTAHTLNRQLLYLESLEMQVMLANTVVSPTYSWGYGPLRMRDGKTKLEAPHSVMGVTNSTSLLAQCWLPSRAFHCHG